MDDCKIGYCQLLFNEGRVDGGKIEGCKVSVTAAVAVAEASREWET
jgi:hypothetical protein